MKAPKHSLRKIVSFLNNPDEDGGFWLPNIQRPFVCDEDQICRLFDSILREYPISKVLWKLDRFDDFVTERKKPILAKFAHLVVSK